jgi:hypothetical protein
LFLTYLGLFRWSGTASSIPSSQKPAKIEVAHAKISNYPYNIVCDHFNNLTAQIPQTALHATYPA